jgi:hypothetical protein
MQQSHDTHVTFVLDASGSMRTIEDDTREGFNGFLHDQTEEEGDATVSLYQFDTEVELVYQYLPVGNADELDRGNYTPSGTTALYDALKRAIVETQEGIDDLPDREKPEKVIVVTLTDEKENSSVTSAEEVRERVEGKRKEGWEFLFIGANQDAALTAKSMGMAADKSLDMQHSGKGTREAYRSTSKSVSRARQEGKTGGYTDEDRGRQEEPREEK